MSFIFGGGGGGGGGRGAHVSPRVGRVGPMRPRPRRGHTPRASSRTQSECCSMTLPGDGVMEAVR